MSSRFDPVRLDRSAISIGDVADQAYEYREAALAMTPEERLLTVEFLRQVYYGPASATGRIPRVLEILDGRAR